MHDRPDSWRHTGPTARLAATTSAAGQIAAIGPRSAARPPVFPSPPPPGAPPVAPPRRNGTHSSAAAPHPEKVAAEPASGRATKPAPIAPAMAPDEPAASTRPSDEPSRPGRASTASLARNGEGRLTSTDAGKKATTTASSMPPVPRAPEA